MTTRRAGEGFETPMERLVAEGVTFPKVTVVIPAYNAERYLQECIKSVLSQDYKNIEIVVVNDGSTDNTWEVARAHLLPPHQILSHGENKGETEACKTGFDAAHGKYITRLAADDYYYFNDHISKQVIEMQKTGADWCYNSVFVTGKNPHSELTVLKTIWFPLPMRFLHDSFQLLDNWFLRHPYLALGIMVTRNPVNSSTLMIERNQYRLFVKYKGKWRTDWDSQVLFSLLLHRCIGRAIPVIGSFYRIHPEQTSNNPAYLQDMKEIRKCLYQYLLRHHYPVWLRLALRNVQ